MSVMTVSLQSEVEQNLDVVAKKLQKSKNWIVNQALSEYLEKQKIEQERWQETLEAMESVAEGKVVDASEVHKWMLSWGSDNELDAPRSGK